MRHVYNLFLVAASLAVFISMLIIFDSTCNTSGKAFAIGTVVFPIILLVVTSRLAIKEWKQDHDDHNTPSLS